MGGNELNSRLGLLFQANQPALGAIAVYVLLRQYGSQPSRQRAATHVTTQLEGSTGAVYLQSIEVGIERICQLLCLSVFPHNSTRSVIQSGAITSEKNLPGTVIPSGASASQHQVFKSQATTQLLYLCLAAGIRQVLYYHLLQNASKRLER